MLRNCLKQSGLLLVTLVAAVVTPSVTSAQSPDFREYQVKAAFIYNFALYVEGPTNADNGGNKPYSVCVIGDNYLGPALASINGRVIRNRRLVVSQVREVEDVGNCDILFISASEKTNLTSFLEAVRSRPVLTISDMERFTQSGGMIGFVTLDNKVRFEINLKQAQRSRLRVSSQLLKLARDVIE
jgi:hypothetical protein